MGEGNTNGPDALRVGPCGGGTERGCFRAFFPYGFVGRRDVSAMLTLLWYVVLAVLGLAAIGFVTMLVIGVGGTILGFAALPIVWLVNIARDISDDWRRRRAARP